MPKHIRRLLTLLIVAAIAGLTAKEWLRDTSFGRFGHYRANAVPEIAAQKPKHRGADSCRSCHARRVAFWHEGRHNRVQCEICHTAAYDHPKRHLSIPSQPVRLCGSCHEALPSHPASSIRQVVIKDHMGEQSCIECHNPHSPTHFRWEDVQGWMNPSPEALRHG